MRQVGEIVRMAPSRGSTVGVIRRIGYATPRGWVYMVQPLFVDDPYAASGPVDEADILPGQIAYPAFTVGQVLTVNVYPATITAVDNETFPATLSLEQVIETKTLIISRHYQGTAERYLSENPLLIQT